MKLALVVLGLLVALLATLLLSGEQAESLGIVDKKKVFQVFPERTGLSDWTLQLSVRNTFGRADRETIARPCTLDAKEEIFKEVAGLVPTDVGFRLLLNSKGFCKEELKTRYELSGAAIDVQFLGK